MEWLLITGTILLSGFFSGSEIAFVTANKLKLEVASRKIISSPVLSDSLLKIRTLFSQLL